MLARVRVFLSLMAVAMVAAPAAAGDAASARLFVKQLYASYGNPASSGPDLRSARFLHRPLLELWDRAEKQADGVVVDADPVCDCQDWDMSDVNITIEPGVSQTAAAVVSFKNFGKRKTVRLDLVETPAGWRIADIHDAPPGLSSVRQLLEDAVAGRNPR